MISPVRRALLFGSVAVALTTSLRTAEADGGAPSVPADKPPTYSSVVPALPYGYDANEPSIDAATMRLHHGRHHAGYVTNLNVALKDDAVLHDVSLQDLLARVDALPEPIRATVRNKAGGHADHTMFWQVMGGRGGAPEGELEATITRDFGSGWAMVVMDRDGALSPVAEANQDSPPMGGRSALFGNDVWGHAYHPGHRTRRPDYLAAWWNVLDWTRIGARHALARSGPIA